MAAALAKACTGPWRWRRPWRVRGGGGGQASRLGTTSERGAAMA